MVVTDLELALPDSAATDVLGAALARAFPGTVQPDGAQGGGAQGGAALLYLRGELGAGKTTCVRAFLRACGVTALVRSPSYTLVETYRLATTPALTCVHVDLYRLEGSAQVDELGLRDFLSQGHLLLIEWPDRGAGALPEPDLELALEFDASGRKARLRACTASGARWLRNLRDDTRLTSYLSNLN